VGKEHEKWVDDSLNAISMGFIEYFKLIEDPRQSHKTRHSLLEIIFISVCAYICGANSWDGVFEFANTREVWLRKYIKLANGVPSRVTYYRAFGALDPHYFQKSFQEWSYSLIGSTKHIAIDGKTLRGTYDPEDSKKSLVLVSAWATDRGILLGQVKTDQKSNEITAIPKLLDMIYVKNCLVSVDAAGCQTKIAKMIIEKGGDYLLALKGNQGKLKEDVETFFQDALESNWAHFDFQSCESVEKGHGRIDTRTVYLVKKMSDCIDQEQWPKIESVVMVISKRRIKDKESIESRYYITSSLMDVTEAALSIRKHWSVENGFHWSMDVGFREDRQVAQLSNLAENLAVLRRIAFNYLNQVKHTGEKDRPLSIENKRLKAAMSTEFLENVLQFG
jgi:predicted transposase YbfD/YdcC